MVEIKLFETWPATDQKSQGDAENWYAEPFTKRKGCQTPGACGDDCDCGCPYTGMTDVERLPLIEEIARIFPNEWLAFIISPEEDDDYAPTHGKLIAHSLLPDEVYDAVTTVLWNQHVYVYFNGDFETMRHSYGETWEQKLAIPSVPLAGQQADTVSIPLQPDALPDNLLELIYSAVDALYDTPNVPAAAMRRLRLARAKATASADSALIKLLDEALEQIEQPKPKISEIIWLLEEKLADLAPA